MILTQVEAGFCIEGVTVVGVPDLLQPSSTATRDPNQIFRMERRQLPGGI